MIRFIKNKKIDRIDYEESKEITIRLKEHNNIV
jgi:hypothetical protein